MNLQQLIEVMKKKPYLLKMGKGLIANRYNAYTVDVCEAKQAVRDELAGKEIKRYPKILIFDIETAPMKAFVWGRWKQNIQLQATISEWFCIAWSAKWLYSNEVHGDVLTSAEALAEDDGRIMLSLWNMINEADIIVAHNGDRFDIPKMNARFIINNLGPTRPYFSVDTCKVAQRQFGFSSNKLDALAGYFGFELKMDTSFSLWKSCMEGDEEALDYMLEYNKKDVTVLEEVYLKLRPWVKGHPNLNNFCELDIPVCSICGSSALKELPGEYYYTGTCKYPLFICKDCGALTRGRKTIKQNIKLVSLGR